MSDIRQEFEAKFKMPEGVKYGSHDSTRTYFAESREHRREADTYRHLWLGYQAAHKAQQAEIERLKAALESAESRAPTKGVDMEILEGQAGLKPRALEGNQ